MLTTPTLCRQHKKLGTQPCVNKTKGKVAEQGPKGEGFAGQLLFTPFYILSRFARSQNLRIIATSRRRKHER